MISSIFKRKLQPFIYKVIKWYYKKPRKITKRGLEFTLQPTVFHPHYYHSTDYLLDYILAFDLNEKHVLELGCGSGFISMYLDKETNAHCFSSDINPNAIRGLRQNVKDLKLDIKVIESDLFDQLDELPRLDYILVNPPYFKKAINSLDEYAFYTGSDHSYFKKFFPQVKIHLEKESKVLCVVSENVKLAEIREIAAENQINWNEADVKLIKDERFMILDLFLL